ncbi:unnamed protein product, partial [Amoebophrya sp. A25]
LLAVTDANVVLGRVLPRFFPRIFGPTEREPLDRTAALRAMEDIAKEIQGTASRDQHQSRNTAEKIQGSVEVHKEHENMNNKSTELTALGFLQIANEKMCRPVRELSESRGFNVKDHVLACFGGAGPQHVCGIARALGIRKAFVHKQSGILSAYGMGLADVSCERSINAARLFADFVGRERTGEGTATGVEVVLLPEMRGADSAITGTT